MRRVRLKWRWGDVMFLVCMVDNMVFVLFLCFLMRILLGRLLNLNCMKYKKLWKKYSCSKLSLLLGFVFYKDYRFLSL